MNVFEFSRTRETTNTFIRLRAFACATVFNVHLGEVDERLSQSSRNAVQLRLVVCPTPLVCMRWINSEIFAFAPVVDYACANASVLILLYRLMERCDNVECPFTSLFFVIHIFLHNFTLRSFYLLLSTFIYQFYYLFV